MRPDIYIYLFMYSSIFCIYIFLNMSVAYRLVGQNNFYSDLLLSSNSSVMLILLHSHLVI